MKVLYRLVTLLLVTVALVGCGGDNSYDGESGLITPEITVKSVDGHIDRIYRLLIQQDSSEAYKNSLALVEAVKNLEASNKVTLQNAREMFHKLTLSYKRVESLYVAGYNSDNMRDVADFYIEQFIKGSKSQDTAGDLESVFNGNKSIVTNALKGITALEYTLFGDAESVASLAEKMNQNRIDAALLMARNLEVQFKSVRDYYKSDRVFLNNSDAAVGALLNVLVNNSFRLRESRIGDAAGFTAKYQNNPDNKRLEYYYSKNSLAAIKEILDTHKRVMENGLKDIAILGNATSEAEAILNTITEARALCDKYSSNLESELSATYTQEIYDTAKVLQNNYTALINGLNFTQDIVEADGD